MFDADVFHSKIVHTECKGDGSPVMLPKTRVDSALVVPVCYQVFFEELLCDDARLWKAIHTFLYSHVDVSIQSCELPEVIKFNEILGYVRDFQAHEFRSVHGCVDVEILDVYCHEPCPLCRNDAGEEDFGC